MKAISLIFILFCFAVSVLPVELLACGNPGSCTPTIGNCSLCDPSTGWPYPGTNVFIMTYHITGCCMSGRDDEMDCYADKHAQEIQKKFAAIKDPVARMTNGLSDRLAFDTYVNAQPQYFCGYRNKVCSSCHVIERKAGAGGEHHYPGDYGFIYQSKAVSCAEGEPKAAATKALLGSYPTWKLGHAGQGASGGNRGFGGMPSAANYLNTAKPDAQSAVSAPLQEDPQGTEVISTGIISGVGEPIDSAAGAGGD